MTTASTVRRVTLDDIVGLSRYEEIRDEFRRYIIALKKRRRVSVGDRISLVFENFDTVRFQIQEMLRAEHIVDLDRIRQEIDVYNALLPGPGELSATLLIEIDDLSRIKEELPKFYGLDRAVWLEVEGRRVAGVFEEGRAREDKVSAVQYVRFPLGEAKEPFVAGRPARIVIEHPYYRASASLSREVQEALAEDLR
jgi:hypothetical protein